MSQRIFLNLGEIYFGQGDLQVETLLGSCVAITLWHAVRRLGGMCHFVLPARGRAAVDDVLDGRYGEEALLRLLQEVRQHDTLTVDYTVKVFGGASVLGLPASENRIGQANADFVLEMLRRLRIKITVQDLAGEGYRYLRFDLNTGDVWVRHGHAELQATLPAQIPGAVLALSHRSISGESKDDDQIDDSR